MLNNIHFGNWQSSGVLNMHMAGKAQSTVEFSILILCLISVILVAGNYFTRGVQGSMRESSDYIGDQYDFLNNTSTDLVQVRNLKTESTVDGTSTTYWLRRVMSFDSILDWIIPPYYTYRRYEDVVSMTEVIMPELIEVCDELCIPMMPGIPDVCFSFNCRDEYVEEPPTTIQKGQIFLEPLEQ